MIKAVKTGFTLIELSLSLVFVGILSIMMVLIISNTVASYRRGVTLNRINTVGMDLVDDMRSAVQNSSAGSLTEECVRRFSGQYDTEAKENCINDGGYSFVTMVNYGNVVLKDGQSINVPIYGAFCTGDFSYIWNSGYYDPKSGSKVEQESATFKYSYKEDGATKTEVVDYLFRILKIKDENRAVCASRTIGSNSNGRPIYIDASNIWKSSGDVTFDISDSVPLDEKPVDLILIDSDNDLALYDLSIAKPAESSTRENLFYSASFILGTIEGGVNIKANGRSCDTPTDYVNELFDYCAINNFNFAVQANGEK